MDVCIPKASKTNGFNYLQYVTMNTDYMLAIYHESHAIVEGVSKMFVLKKVIDTKKTYYSPKRYPLPNFGKFCLPYVSIATM